MDIAGYTPSRRETLNSSWKPTSAAGSCPEEEGRERGEERERTRRVDRKGRIVKSTSFSMCKTNLQSAVALSM